jgi:hypothetical protein
MQSIESDFWAEQAQIKAESMGWMPLDHGAYFHTSPDSSTSLVIEVVGLLKSDMNSGNILWLF